jgi:Raf kinase inhibitor-like YbhB/YbcL family protein
MLDGRSDVMTRGFRSSSQAGRTALLLLTVPCLGLGWGCQPPSPEAPLSIELTSTAFQPGLTMPTQYTGDGGDRSPPLRWSEPPSGTRSLALICADPDAPLGTWVHWVLFNLPPQTRELEEGVPATETLDSGARQGKNDFGKVGYGGPAPPGGKPHRYVFTLYALDAAVDLPPGPTRAQLVDAMRGHTLAKGELVGQYGR